MLIKVRSKFIHIDNKKDKISLKDKTQLNNIDKYVIYELDPRLLKRILSGPKFAHWNIAEVGSHIKFFRKPNIFDRKIYESMCYFHA